MEKTEELGQHFLRKAISVGKGINIGNYINKQHIFL